MYFCELCDYSTLNKQEMDFHHIVPKELEGSDNLFNRVWLCARCHRKVYVEGSMSGIHSTKNNDSIVIKGWFNSTEGKLLLIITPEGIEKYIDMKNL